MRFHGATVFSLSSPFTLPPPVYQLYLLKKEK